jgi:hypothetical protein
MVSNKSKAVIDDDEDNLIEWDLILIKPKDIVITNENNKE